VCIVVYKHGFGYSTLCLHYWNNMLLTTTSLHIQPCTSRQLDALQFYHFTVIWHLHFSHICKVSFTVEVWPLRDDNNTIFTPKFTWYYQTRCNSITYISIEERQLVTAILPTWGGCHQQRVGQCVSRDSNCMGSDTLTRYPPI